MLGFMKRWLCEAFFVDLGELLGASRVFLVGGGDICFAFLFFFSVLFLFRGGVTPVVCFL